MQRRTFLATSALTMAGFHLPKAFAQPGKPIKLGAILTVTGPIASYAALYRTAFDLAVEDLNAKGGINGRPVELIIEDDAAQPAQSVSQFRKLVNADVAAVFGPMTGLSWENVAPLANRMKTPALCWTSLKVGISVKPYALRIHPSNDSMIAEGVAEFFKLKPEIKRVMLAGDEQEATGVQAMQLYKQGIEQAGGQVAGSVGFQTRTTDFTPIATKIRSENPDALFMSAFAPPTMGLLTELRAQGFDKPVLTDATGWAGGLINTIGAAGENLFTIGFNTNEPTPERPLNDAFRERYLKRSSETTNLPQPANLCNTSLCYDSMMLVAELLTKGGVGNDSDVKDMREIVKKGFEQLESWQGINAFQMRPSGDGHIQSHLLKADPAEKIWRYALPAQERLTKQRIFIL